MQILVVDLDSQSSLNHVPHKIVWDISTCWHKLLWIDKEMAASGSEVAASSKEWKIFCSKWRWGESGRRDMFRRIYINCITKPKMIWSTSIFIHIFNESILYSMFGVRQKSTRVIYFFFTMGYLMKIWKNIILHFGWLMVKVNFIFHVELFFVIFESYFWKF